MKRLLLLITAFYTVCFSIHSQVFLPLNDPDIDTTIVTLYEIGKPIDSCECNFENLFNNWTTQYITNAEEIKLISYEFVETLNDTNIDYYTKQFVQLNALGGRTFGYSTISCKFTTDSIIDKKSENIRYLNLQFRLINTENIQAEDLEKVSIQLKEELGRERKAFRETIKINDKVYLIIFEYGGQTLKNYVICSSETNRIIKDNVFNISAFLTNIRLY